MTRGYSSSADVPSDRFSPPNLEEEDRWGPWIYTSAEEATNSPQERPLARTQDHSPGNDDRLLASDEEGLSSGSTVSANSATSSPMVMEQQTQPPDNRSTVEEEASMDRQEDWQLVERRQRESVRKDVVARPPPTRRRWNDLSESSGVSLPSARSQRDGPWRSRERDRLSRSPERGDSRDRMRPRHGREPGPRRSASPERKDSRDRHPGPTGGPQRTGGRDPQSGPTGGPRVVQHDSTQPRHPRDHWAQPTRHVNRNTGSSDANNVRENGPSIDVGYVPMNPRQDANLVNRNIYSLFFNKNLIVCESRLTRSP